MTDRCHRIGLGTVQFGIDYGITNTGGMTPVEEAGAILDLAAQNGINLLDTAHLYGQSEAAIGRAVLPGQNFKIVTKTPDFGKLDLHDQGQAAKALEIAFTGSLRNLKTAEVYGLMVHNAGGMRGPHAKEIYEALTALKSTGLIQKIGLSVYTEDDIENVLNHCGKIDLVQVPCNIFDQRLIRSGYLRKLKDIGVEIHARSLFLQGALLTDQVPERLSMFKPAFNHYHQFLQQNNITALRACMELGFSVPEIDRLIIGVNNAEQLQDIIDIARDVDIQEFDFSALASDDENMINPAFWPKS